MSTLSSVTLSWAGCLHFNSKNQDDIVNAATSFDGSWGSQGWSSATGCMAAIAEEAEILDVAVPCDHCNEC